MSLCQETAGFLISAPCKRKAARKCSACKKPVCEHHSRAGRNQLDHYCITCYRKKGARYTDEDDDPYLYTGFYYDDYYHRSHSRYWDNWDDSDRAAYESYGSDNDGDWESDFDGS